ncbi:Hypothetical protein ZOSMA_46G00610 [Zostera marina]|uniref:Uncharacterized protein n=1 Tax=Zostera marina TaxID=29655 RepID=A0A0K9P000_ZOSMR|nr:Hypothetical protein ZOSMA_46G00610 [Zostera marina]
MERARSAIASLTDSPLHVSDESQNSCFRKNAASPVVKLEDQRFVDSSQNVRDDTSRLRNVFPIPVPNDSMPIPTFFSAPMTVARWNAMPEFVKEFGLQNPEWKLLQSIPCSTLLEGAILHSMNAVLPLKVAQSQISHLISENASYRFKIMQLNARCKSLSLRLDATMKYCQEISLKLHEQLHPKP